MGVSEKKRGGGYQILGVLMIRILLFLGTILGSPIFGNPHVRHVRTIWQFPCIWGVLEGR